MIMRNKITFNTTILLIAILVGGCSKSLIPGKSLKAVGKEYNTAEFDYTYVEALRQKLLGNYGDALKYLEECIQLYPESDAAYFQMAQIVSESGDLKNARVYALKALSLDEQNLWYLMTVGGICYRQKSIDSAIIYYEKASKLFPYKTDILSTLGNLYTENQNFTKATSIYETAFKKGTMNEEMSVSFIKNLLAEKKYDEALAQAELLKEKHPDKINYTALIAGIYREKGDSESATKVYSQMIEDHPQDGVAQVVLADFLLNEKKYEDFFTIINSVSLNNKVLLQDKIGLFSKLIEDKDIIEDKDGRLTMSLMVLEANYKEDMIVPLLRVDQLVKTGQFTEAASRLEEIIKQNAGNYYAWEKLLLVYIQIPDYKKLMIKGEECATKFNTSFFAKILYANGALENGKYQLALDELRKAEILAGEDKDKKLQIYTMRADIAYRMKEYDNAFKYFDQAIKTDENDLTVLNNYAYYLAEQNLRLKEAGIMAKKAVQMDSNNTTFLDTYAWVLFKQGKVKDAARIMEEIIAKAEKPDAEWYEHYGYILKKQKKMEKAAENWAIALKLDGKKVHLVKEIENCKR